MPTELHDTPENPVAASPPPHLTAILAVAGFVPFDLSIPYNIFRSVTLADGRKPYAVFFSGPEGSARSDAVSITGIRELAALATADTVIVPGVMDAMQFHDDRVAAALRKAASNGARIASICTGACVLAAARLLDGLRATTHWEIAAQLQATYPAVSVEPEVLFVDNGSLLTSAGLASGIDLCLHLIRKDFGAAEADKVAEFFVVPPEREGRSSQRIRSRVTHPGEDGFAALQLWLLENLHLPLTLQDIARQAFASPRTLNRRFLERTGEAPMAWLTRMRVRRAQAQLETGSLSVEQIASAVGFGSSAAMRDAFRRLVGVSPAAWRKTYGPGSAG